MNKKSVIILACVAVAFMMAIAGAVYALYSGVGSGGSDKRLKADTAILAAIPSDAAAVMTFQDLGKGMPVLSHFCSGPFKDFIQNIIDAKSLSGVSVAASLHYSGSLVPLLVISKADSSLYRAALTAGLASQIVSNEQREFLLVSPSETIVSSSARHFGAGASILDNSAFEALARSVGQNNVVYFSNDYADRLVSAYDAFFGKYSSFLKRAAEWTAIYGRGASQDQWLLKTFSGKDPSYFMNVLDGLQPSGSKMGEVAPTNTVFALSLSPSKPESYHSAYNKYLDATQRLSENKRLAESLRSATGVSPEQWLKDVQEVASISWKLDDGTVLTANAVRRSGQAAKEPGLSDGYTYAGFAACEFGSLFSLPDEDCSLVTGNWTVSGSRAALEDLMAAISAEEVLGDQLVSKDCLMTMYYTSNDTKLLRYTRTGLEMDVQSAVVKSNRTPELVVEIPEGPFEVTNSQTNKKNTFYQNAQLSLCLNDENGKGLWGVPFKQKLCGYVSDIDYYNNGKIQFLFGAGSSLYAISRLGAFVQGFPVELGKEILLGPEVYDFTGAKGYTVMVLHKDNTLEMYDLHGKKPASWQGITTQDIIIKLPELLTVSGQRYWKVTTTRDTLYFGFDGGEQIKDRRVLNSLK